MTSILWPAFWRGKESGRVRPWSPVLGAKEPLATHPPRYAAVCRHIGKFAIGGYIVPCGQFRAAPSPPAPSGGRTIRARSPASGRPAGPDPARAPDVETVTTSPRRLHRGAARRTHRKSSRQAISLRRIIPI